MNYCFCLEADMAVTILSFIGKFCISAAWQIMLIWQTEIYPTTQRCMLSALNGVIGRVGTVAAPYMVDFVSFNRNIFVLSISWR